jgi:hypothetical protein
MAEQSNSPAEIWDELYQGARWVRADFHLHTPDVHSFRYPPGADPNDPEQKASIAREYVQQLVSQRIELASITDYNGIRKGWFELIRAEAERRGIRVLPGAELSFSATGRGLHVLAIFAEHMNLDAINRVIHSHDADQLNPLFESETEHRDIQPTSSLEEVLKNIRDQTGCLLIAAHPRSDKGLFKAYKPKEQVRFINDVRPDGVEGLSKDERERLLNRGAEAEVMERVATLECSDPKSIDEIGTKTRPDGSRRATCLKLSTVEDLNAIRVALHDGDVRTCTGERPRIQHTWLRLVHVEGTGFLGGLKLALSPELNTLIGGRGVGKSALLETIRYALNLEPYTPTDYRDSLAKHALGSGGKVTLYLDQQVGEKTVRHYRVERIAGEDPRVYELNPDRALPLAPMDIFADDEAPLFFGQKEIYAVTQDEAKRLRLLDEIIGRRAADKQREVRKIEGQLRQNARTLLDLDRQTAERADAQDRLNRINHELDVYREEGIEEKLKQATLLAQDEVRLKQQRAFLEEAAETWAQTETEIGVPLGRAANHAPLAQSAQAELVKEAGQTLATLRERLVAALRAGDAAIMEARQQLEEIDRRWKQGRAPLDEEIRETKQQIGETDLDLDDLERLTREQTQVKEQVERLAVLAEERSRAQADRTKLLASLQGARHTVFKLRQQQATEINKRLQGRVRVDIAYKGDGDEFTQRITNQLQGSGARRDAIAQLCIGGDGDVVDGPKIATVVREGVPGIPERLGVTAAQANQIHGWLTADPGRLYELELMMPEDRVDVLLKVGEDERPLKRLSGGQQATAMLLLLLALTDRPLIVDQPEEDLDNRFVYDDIVRILRDQKGKRQFIFATHNANIPVTADAELIVALMAEADHASIDVQGGIDRAAVRDAVKQIMEGGEEALRRRAEKYGWFDSWKNGK